jgi:hypothetical protein
MDPSEPQLLELFDAHWSGRTSNCPGCQATLDAKRSNVLGGYLLTFRCPNGCDIPELPSSSDPRWPEFRDWTTTEQTKLLADFAAKRSPQCPVCAVPISGRAKWVFSGQLVQIRCERCRRQCEDTLPR